MTTALYCTVSKFSLNFFLFKIIRSLLLYRGMRHWPEAIDAATLRTTLRKSGPSGQLSTVNRNEIMSKLCLFESERSLLRAKRKTVDRLSRW